MPDAPSSRPCPHCGKEISVRATRCKHCLEQVNAVLVPSSVPGTLDSAHAAPPDITMPGSTSHAWPMPTIRCKYLYRVVPFIGTMRSGLFSRDSAETVSAQLQSLVERYADQGWEFHSMAKVDIQVTPGCLGPILGQHSSYISFDQVIFRREA